GIITGLDGSGFSGLPLTGALAASLENSSIDASTLAAIGQMGSIWTGGGTIVAWSSLIAIAGFCGVSVMDLVRKNFLPVMVGLFITTIAPVIIFLQNDNNIPFLFMVCSFLFKAIFLSDTISINCDVTLALLPPILLKMSANPALRKNTRFPWGTLQPPREQKSLTVGSSDCSFPIGV